VTLGVGLLAGDVCAAGSARTKNSTATTRLPKVPLLPPIDYRSAGLRIPVGVLGLQVSNSAPDRDREFNAGCLGRHPSRSCVCALEVGQSIPRKCASQPVASGRRPFLAAKRVEEVAQSLKGTPELANGARNVFSAFAGAPEGAVSMYSAGSDGDVARAHFLIVCL
jgi:hypothetical protein